MVKSSRKLDRKTNGSITRGLKQRALEDEPVVFLSSFLEDLTTLQPSPSISFTALLAVAFDLSTCSGQVSLGDSALLSKLYLPQNPYSPNACCPASTQTPLLQESQHDLQEVPQSQQKRFSGPIQPLL